jgi:hypothetical protein
MSELRSKAGLLNYRDGRALPARFYYGPDEAAPQTLTQIDPERYATWTESDGAVGIRRGTSVSIGASATYSKNYDTVDWGN